MPKPDERKHADIRFVAYEANTLAPPVVNILLRGTLYALA